MGSKRTLEMWTLKFLYEIASQMPCETIDCFNPTTCYRRFSCHQHFHFLCWLAWTRTHVVAQVFERLNKRI